MVKFRFTQLVMRNSCRIGVQNEELIPLSGNHKEICRFDNKHAHAYRKTVQVCQTHGVGINGADPTRRKYNTTTMLCSSSTKQFTYQLLICRSKSASGH
jgi:hypothetical protein